MSKIPYKEFIKSITMFFINDDVDRKYLGKKSGKTIRSQTADAKY